ncbi:hypothetical protein F2Q69_00029637 [Brassica cretica]|uniref:Uncharacterized protein n=1 Tax=Brassica cretica TaxID=69181 RepID=A0A8S9RZC7_BRACR|nr:hypothetical protein F2Q69_00029637 [Brassica cretica]
MDYKSEIKSKFRVRIPFERFKTGPSKSAKKSTRWSNVIDSPSHGGPAAFPWRSGGLAAVRWRRSGGPAAGTIPGGCAWPSRERRQNFEQSVRLRPSFDYGEVGVYGFVLMRGTRWQAVFRWLASLANGGDEIGVTSRCGRENNVEVSIYRQISWPLMCAWSVAG